MERNELSFEEAEKRWRAGVDNYSVVQNADVVFATQWKHEFTQVQVSLIKLSNAAHFQLTNRYSELDQLKIQQIRNF